MQDAGDTAADDQADHLGAMNCGGSDDDKGGFAGGEYLGKQGKKKGVCLNTLPGTANIEAFCKGCIDGVTATDGSAEALPATSFGSATLSCAPCCWGIDDLRNPHLPAWGKTAGQAAAAGFGGLELRPYG